MSRESILMILGALVILSPWSGLPLEWLEWVLLALGLIVVGIGYTLRKRDVKSQNPSSTPPSEPYVSEPADLLQSPKELPKPRSSRMAIS